MKRIVSLGKTPDHSRYSGYDTQEEEDEYFAILGPVWCDGDPIPAEELKLGVGERKPA